METQSNALKQWRGTCLGLSLDRSMWEECGGKGKQRELSSCYELSHVLMFIIPFSPHNSFQRSETGSQRRHDLP